MKWPFDSKFKLARADKELRCNASLDAGESLGPIKKGWYLLNIFVGLVIMGGGLWAALSDLHDASTGTLFDSACHLEYAYSPTNPDDPCYISGNVSSFDDGRRFGALVTQLV